MKNEEKEVRMNNEREKRIMRRKGRRIKEV